MTVQSVQQHFESDGTVHLEEVKRWLKSADIDVAGATFTFLLEPEHFRKVKPDIRQDVFLNISFDFLEECMRRDPKSEWAPSRYEAAHTLNNLIRKSWTEISPRLAEWIKGRLGQFYLSSDDSVRLSLETGTLEHLFEDREIRQYFSGWNNDQGLRGAFQRSCDWSPELRSADIPDKS